MKKRFLAILLVILLTLSLFSCCFENPEAPTNVSEQASEEEVSKKPEAPDKKPEKEDPPKEEEKIDFFTENGQGTLPEKAVIPPNCEPTQTQYLYKLNLEGTNNIPFSYKAEIKSDILYVFCWVDDETVAKAYSIKSGKFLFEAGFSIDAPHGVLKNGSLWTVDPETLEAVIYDKNGKKTVVHKGNPNENTEFGEIRSVISAGFSDDGKYMLVAFNSGSPLELFDLKKGESTTLDIPKGRSVWGIEYSEKGFVFTDSNEFLYLLDPVSAELKRVETCDEYSYAYYFNGFIRYSSDDFFALEAFDSDGKKFFMQTELTEAITDISCGIASTYDYSENTEIRFYDLRKSVLFSSVVLDANAYSADAILNDDGTALLVSYGNEVSEFFIYDVSSAMKKQGEEIKSIVATEEELRKKTEEIAKAAEEKTGFDLFYSSEGNDFSDFSYVAVAKTNPYSVYNIVTEVSEVFDKYPEGMLRETFKDTHKGLKFYLCSDIYGIGYSALDRAGGFTTEESGYIIVVIDVNEELDVVIPHELSHVFDRRIEYISSQTDKNWMEIWESATPVPNPFKHTYSNYEFNTKYTVDGEFNPENVWFVGPYSRTFPTEDRSTLMEVMFNYDNEYFQELLEYENLKYKACLYSYILRQCFDSCKNAKNIHWEHNLGNIDESLWTDFAA